MAKAKRESPCGICHKLIQPGEEINHFWGKPAHESCIGQSYRPEQENVQRKRGRKPRGRKFR